MSNEHKQEQKIPVGGAAEDKRTLADVAREHKVSDRIGEVLFPLMEKLMQEGVPLGSIAGILMGITFGMSIEAGLPKEFIVKMYNNCAEKAAAEKAKRKPAESTEKPAEETK